MSSVASDDNNDYNDKSFIIKRELVYLTLAVAPTFGERPRLMEGEDIRIDILAINDYLNYQSLSMKVLFKTHYSFNNHHEAFLSLRF